MAKMPRDRKIQTEFGDAVADVKADEAPAPTKPRRKRIRSEDGDRDSPAPRSSAYRGVTRHRWTGRFEAHLWDKDSWNESQNKKGKQVYLGAYDDEASAARAYDQAALKYWGQQTTLNFPLSVYEEELKEMEGQTKEEYIGSLRRKSSGFSRGVSKYRGVARHHHNGKWEARIGRVFGNKYLYLGTFATQEEAATAYDMAAIEHRGANAVTNFDISRYVNPLTPNSSTTSASPTPEIQPSPQEDPPGPSCRRPRKRRSRPNATAPNPDDSSESKPDSLVSSAGGGDGESPTSTLLPETDHQPRSRCFPDDIQTYFGFHDPIDGSSGIFDECIISSELSSFSTPFSSFCFESFDTHINGFVL